MVSGAAEKQLGEARRRPSGVEERGISHGVELRARMSGALVTTSVALR
jgi:hypothetical protein